MILVSKIIDFVLGPKEPRVWVDEACVRRLEKMAAEEEARRFILVDSRQRSALRSEEGKP